MGYGAYAFENWHRYFQGIVLSKNMKKVNSFKGVKEIKDVTEDISSSCGNNPKSTFLRTSSISIIH